MHRLYWWRPPTSPPPGAFFIYRALFIKSFISEWWRTSGAKALDSLPRARAALGRQLALGEFWWTWQTLFLHYIESYISQGDTGYLPVQHMVLVRVPWPTFFRPWTIHEVFCNPRFGYIRPFIVFRYLLKLRENFKLCGPLIGTKY